MPTWVLILQCLPLVIVIVGLLLIPRTSGHRWMPPVPPPKGWDAQSRDIISDRVKRGQVSINQVLDMHGYRNLPKDIRKEFMRELKRVSRYVTKTNVS